jgi:hypothetical protein
VAGSGNRHSGLAVHPVGGSNGPQEGPSAPPDGIDNDGWVSRPMRYLCDLGALVLIRSRSGIDASLGRLVHKGNWGYDVMAACRLAMAKVRVRSPLSP